MQVQKVIPFLKIVFSRCREYTQRSTIHGLRQVTHTDHKYYERCMWVVLFLMSLMGMLLTIKGTMNSYWMHAVSFTTDSSYLHWNTSFPAVSVCELLNGENQWDITEEYFAFIVNSPTKPKKNRSAEVVYGRNRDHKIDDYIADISFFSGICTSCLDPWCSHSCPTNYSEILDLFRKKCNDLFMSCTWNGVEFNCCELFLPLETEFGICFSINSKHTTPPFGKQLIANRVTGPGVLKFNVMEDIDVFLHSSEDVPYYNHDPEIKQSLLWGSYLEMLFSVVEIINDPEMPNMNLERRGCRFPSELQNGMKVYQHYSYSTCIVQCRADAQLRLCNCTHHLMPSIYQNNTCDLEGLKCLTLNYETLISLKSKGNQKPGLVCDCMPSCVEPEYSMIYKNDVFSDAIDGSVIEIRMQALPSLRYVRNIAKSRLDIVVSMGGLMGLFFGASLLSFVELIYFLLFRNWNIN